MRPTIPALHCLLLICLIPAVVTADVNDDIRRDFPHPPPGYKPRPLWFWNGDVDSTGIELQIEQMHASGYSGFAILPDLPMPRDHYLSDEYFDHYGLALDQAAALGLTATIYDEYHFPSGNLGERFCDLYPDHCARYLDMNVVHGTGPATIAVAVPDGLFLGAVALDHDTWQRIDISHLAAGDSIAYDAPAGRWSVFGFACRDAAWEHVDFLAPAAVEKLITHVHDEYADRFPQHIGGTVDQTFYDEPAFYWVPNGAAWTCDFNATFAERFGYDPICLYPALWTSIGEDTEAARNALLGHRAELYAEGFPKLVSDWCRRHGLTSTGHVDQEEVINPVGIIGDLMKAFEHQDVPGVDEVRHYGRASRAYKVVSSAAYNYDRRLVMTETYGAMGADIPVATLYRDLMDQYAKGINVVMPHAVWYHDEPIKNPPDLSADNPRYGPALPGYNIFAGRCSRILQHGRHVADIGMLYPIAALQGSYRFTNDTPRLGGYIPPEADYMEVGEILSLVLRRDFTYLHPEVLDARCEVAGDRLHLRNDVNPEEYRVFIMPGGVTINWSNLQTIKRFYDQGGTVIATTRLPVKSAEFGHDADVQEAVREIFGVFPFATGYPDISASTTQAPGEHHAAQVADENPMTWWSPHEYAEGSQWLEVDLGFPTRIDRLVIRGRGDHTRAYRVLYQVDDAWAACAEGDAIGPRREHELPAIETTRLRLSIDEYDDLPQIVEFELYGPSGSNLALLPPVSNMNENGGRAYFAPSATAGILGAILAECLPVPDILIEEEIPAHDLSGGNLSYIHKHVDGTEYYYFANSSDDHLDLHVRLRGAVTPELWDPHTGTISSVAFTHESHGGEAVCRLRLELPPVGSVFVVGRR